ncbi:MAG: hypothetical protein J7J85_00185 [Deltaproteobacteria bacterium]|nr:hypothetical protein [Deltaproteobacteria bacterium]
MHLSGIGENRLLGCLDQNWTSRKTLNVPAGTKVTALQETNLNLEALHLDISLKDGSKVSMDYMQAVIEQKTYVEIKGLTEFHPYIDARFSTRNVSKRILDFLKSLWDGTLEQLGELRAAVFKGIAKARMILGEIPEWLDKLITKTQRLIYKGIDRMSKEAIPQSYE